MLKSVILSARGVVECNKRLGSLQVTELCVCETHSDMNNSAERRSALFSVSDRDATGTVAQC